MRVSEARKMSKTTMHKHHQWWCDDDWDHKRAEKYEKNNDFIVEQVLMLVKELKCK